MYKWQGCILLFRRRTEFWHIYDEDTKKQTQGYNMVGSGAEASIG